MAAKLYERDWNRYPAMSHTFESGPCVYVPLPAGPKRRPYVDIVGEDVLDWPRRAATFGISPTFAQMRVLLRVIDTGLT